MFKRLIILSCLFAAPLSLADDYVIDTKGAHAFINFKVNHLGYSWLSGRFNTFAGKFNYDKADPASSKIEVNIDTASVDSNHAERDKHLRSDDFLDVKKFPQAKFVSRKFIPKENGKAILRGDLTLHGITREIEIKVNKIGEGSDPWGGYRVGFSGKVKFAMADFGIKKNLGPASKEVTLYLGIEGIRQ